MQILVGGYLMGRSKLSHGGINRLMATIAEEIARARAEVDEESTIILLGENGAKQEIKIRKKKENDKK
jgi:hypothetical protein